MAQHVQTHVIETHAKVIGVVSKGSELLFSNGRAVKTHDYLQKMTIRAERELETDDNNIRRNNLIPIRTAHLEATNNLLTDNRAQGVVA